MSIKDIANKLKAAWDKKDCKAFDETVASLKDEGTEVHLHTGEGEGRSAYDDDTLKGLFEENEAKHKAMDERMTACEGKMSAADAKMKDEEEKKKKEDEDAKAKDAAKEKEEAEMKDALADEAPAGKEEEAKTAKDSSFLVSSYQDVKAKAEIISPGIALPGFDKAAEPKKTFLSICDLRRKAIQSAARDTDTLALILKLKGGKAFDSASFDKMHCSQVKTVFDSLAEMKRLVNNAKATEKRSDTSAILKQDHASTSVDSFIAARAAARKGR